MTNTAASNDMSACLPPNNPDRIDRYYYPEEMAGADRTFTFHVNFIAYDEDHAKLLAERYARGMNQMRLEVAPYTAKVSSNDDWSAARPVCCLANGPDPDDLCTELAGHRCEHNGPGVTGRWVDAQIPRQRQPV